MTDTTADFPEGDVSEPPAVPDFEFLRPVGRGGFGQVWLARNQTTGLLRAVKVVELRPSGAGDPAGREITSITRLEEKVRTRHAHLLAIHHVGKTSRHLFYVMDPADDVTGERALSEASYEPATLERRLNDGPLPPEDCLRFTEQLLDGLAHLHAAGTVHRDVKPANCLFVDGQLKLGDFGLLAETSPQVSRVGTQKYMPPDGRMDTRADIYAAGLVIYEMLTGLPVESFPRLGPRARETGSDGRLQRLNRLALRACQQEPGLRFRDAQAMLGELNSPSDGRTRHRLPRWMIAAAAGLVILLIAVATVIGLWRRGPKPVPAGEPARVTVNFVTQPFEASIEWDGEPLLTPQGQPYLTPCTVPDLPAGRHRVVFRHPQRDDLVAGEIDFNTTQELEASWGGVE